MFILLLVAAGACLVAIYIYYLCQNVQLGWFSLLLVSLVNFTFGTNQSAIGGLHLSPPDLVAMCLLVAGAVRTIPRLRERNTPRLIAFGYLAVFAFSYIRGVMEFGFPAASNEARGYVSTLAAMLYFLTAPADESSVAKYLKTYILYGSALVVVAILAYAGLNVGALAWTHGQGADAVNGRLLPSAAAAAVCICFLLTLGRLAQRGSGIFQQLPPIIFLGLAIFLRHRTIWLMLVVVFGCMFLLDKVALRRLIPTLLILGVLAAGASLLLAPDVSNEQTDQLSDAATNDGTFLWRLHSWTEVLEDEDQTPFTVLFGSNMGNGFWRFLPESGVYANLPPHSEYVAEYARVGLLGMPFLLAFLLRPVRFFWREAQSNNVYRGTPASIWCLVLVAALVYGFTYSIETDLYALVAFASAISVREKRILEDAGAAELAIGVDLPQEHLVPSHS
jgi:O-antigen ligase